ncbi:MAG: aminomethyl-transferring glycine dehydrogenase subunit GcvPB [Deltaproteobacteria bacterium]|nr:aminomethyl-transferring glycine dehydrogenase subunit GcvPB [Deltaproteobacteria bacterium]
MKSKEGTVYKQSRKGRQGFSINDRAVADKNISDYLPKDLIRTNKARLPELSEFDVVRHYTRLSQQNFAIDTNFYPLGSCTMKYNPRINEETSSYDGFANTHPWQYQHTVQGNLKLMYELGESLKTITGMAGVTLQPAAGAHGEFTGLLCIRAFLENQGNPRKKVIIPDSAHGTNPSSAKLCGYDIVKIPTGPEGIMDVAAVAKVMDEDVAALMVTNPSTLGIFEKNIKEIADLVHDKGGFVYCDGANMNAVMGNVVVADLGVDCLHFNLHKTFTTPHGGGGPGSGPIVVSELLEPFLPKPVIKKTNEGRYVAEFDRPQSIGRVRAFFGNFGMLVRAYTYIRELGPEGIKQVSDMAVLNANYIRARLKDHYSLAFEAPSMHEVVFSDKSLKGTKVKTLDVAKRLLEFGMHAPTIYFPITVSGALMIEPTETENKETLDEFCETMIQIAKEAKESPEKLTEAPQNTFRSRLNEVKAVREPVLREQW